MIRLGLYSHTIDYAGTWRSHERIAEILQKNQDYKIIVFYSDVVNNNRLEVAKKILHNCEFVSFDRSIQKSESRFGYSPLETNISKRVKEKNIDVFHFARSGYYEWPFTLRMAPVQIETNIFGYEDNSEFLDGSIVISESLRLSTSERREIIYNSIPDPTKDYSSLKCLREDMKIPREDLVFGRIGRPSNFTPISLIAYANFVKTTPNSRYVIIGPCDETKRCVAQLNLGDKVIFVDPTNDDQYIERFHKTIDVFAHYRSDGETFGSSIAHAMVYGRPVITHYAGQNAQELTIGKGGICVSSVEEYFSAMKFLSERKNLNTFGENAREHAKKHYNQEVIAQKHDSFYRKIGKLKGCNF